MMSLPCEASHSALPWQFITPFEHQHFLGLQIESTSSNYSINIAVLSGVGIERNRSDQGLIQLGIWENGDAMYPNGELGRVVTRNIKLWNKQKSLVLDILSFFTLMSGLWEIAK